MTLALRFIGILLVLLTNQAIADLQTAQRYLPSAELVGKARMEYLFWDVYDAELYAPHGIWNKSQPFALSLQYLLELDGEAIASRSVSEIRAQGFDDEDTLARWYEAMRGIFPDVDETTRITGIMDRNQHTRFYRNGALIGKIDEPLFGEWFFNIWLSEETSEPKMRERLLGVNKR